MPEHIRHQPDVLPRAAWPIRLKPLLALLAECSTMFSSLPLDDQD